MSPYSTDYRFGAECKCNEPCSIPGQSLLSGNKRHWPTSKSSLLHTRSMQHHSQHLQHPQQHTTVPNIQLTVNHLKVAYLEDKDTQSKMDTQFRMDIHPVQPQVQWNPHPPINTPPRITHSVVATSFGPHA